MLLSTPVTGAMNHFTCLPTWCSQPTVCFHFGGGDTIRHTASSWNIHTHYVPPRRSALNMLVNVAVINRWRAFLGPLAPADGDLLLYCNKEKGKGRGGARRRGGEAETKRRGREERGGETGCLPPKVGRTDPSPNRKSTAWLRGFFFWVFFYCKSLQD